MLAHARRLVVMLLVATVAVGLASPAASGVVATQLSLSPRTATVKWHGTVRLVTRIADALGPMSGVHVTFWQRSGSRPWQRAATVTTDRQGAAALARRLSSSTQWQARYPGDLVHDGAASPVTTVKVLPPPRPRFRGLADRFGKRVVREAARHRGAPYEYGAAGPYRFDCSGLTRFVFARFHISLPHNAAAQYQRARNVARSRKVPGDLIFFYSGYGGIYHVGIYAGHGRMWAATHTGDVVRLESIYSASYVVGRVR